MYFTRRAAADGCVAVLTTNASPAMAPWGGREKVLGTNPWSIAAPGPDGAGRRRRHRQHRRRARQDLPGQEPGEPIPDRWALTADGAPTTDPAEGVLGVVLPMAGHKGYAITFLMDVLSGALTGSGVGTEVHGPYEPEARSRAGHLFLAIDPSALGDPADYEARVQRLIDEVKDVPLAQGFDEVFYPGEVEDRAEAANLAAGGVPSPRESLADLRRLGDETGVVPDGGNAAVTDPGPSKADQVHAQLKEEIELGELAPGTPLSELSLVERTGASRTPVREALRRLAAEGLVDLTPRLGARVSRVSAAERARPVRVPAAARARGDPPGDRGRGGRSAGPPRLHGDAHRVRPHPAPARRRRHAPRAFYELADRFDWAIIDATRNEHLRRTIAELRPHTARLRNLSHLDPQRTDVSVTEHLAICDALLAGDADAAASRIAGHLAESVRTIFRNLARPASPTAG